MYSNYTIIGICTLLYIVTYYNDIFYNINCYIVNISITYIDTYCIHHMYHHTHYYFTLIDNNTHVLNIVR